jgi:hypothetical protein
VNQEETHRERLTRLFERGEDSRYQFKRELKSYDQLAVEISALANTEGGQLWPGIAELLSFLEKETPFGYTGRRSGIPRVQRLLKDLGVGIEFFNHKEARRFLVKSRWE